MIDLSILGTGGALPLPDRGLSSLYVRVNGRGLLIDCGEATQTAIRRSGWGFRCIEDVFLTHYHGDHCGGLPGFLLSMAKTGRTEPLHLWGGTGLKRIVDGLCVIVPHLPYPMILHEQNESSFDFRSIGLELTAFSLDHSVPCYGLSIRLKRPGAFLPERAKTLGVPVREWKSLQRGLAVQVEGRTVQPEDTSGPERPGIHFLYATDTRPVPAVVQYGRHADLMILEGMYGDEAKRPQALKNKHMLFSEAAQLAAEAEAKSLVLTHFSNAEENPEEHLPAAQRIFSNTAAAEDLMKLRLDYPPTGEQREAEGL